MDSTTLPPELRILRHALRFGADIRGKPLSPSAQAALVRYLSDALATDRAVIGASHSQTARRIGRARSTAQEAARELSRAGVVHPMGRTPRGARRYEIHDLEGQLGHGARTASRPALFDAVQGLKPRETAVLIDLVCRSWGAESIEVQLAELGKSTGMTAPTLRKALAALERLRRVRRLTGGRGRVGRFEVLVEGVADGAQVPSLEAGDWPILERLTPDGRGMLPVVLAGLPTDERAEFRFQAEEDLGPGASEQALEAREAELVAEEFMRAHLAG